MKESVRSELKVLFLVQMATLANMYELILQFNAILKYFYAFAINFVIFTSNIFFKSTNFIICHTAYIFIRYFGGLFCYIQI